jgi:hypothetical protein
MNELWIYDRFGAPVYHVKNISKESDFWDPLDTRSPDGTYYFRFMAKNNFGLVKRNGVIEVVRRPSLPLLISYPSKGRVREE